METKKSDEWLELLAQEIGEFVLRQDVQIAFAALCMLIVLRWLARSLLQRGGGRSGRVAVIAGPCNSGKTALFYQLTRSSANNGTVASMQENEGLCILKTEKGRTVGAVKLVDVPGHPRLRHKLEEHLKDASVVVFVVDAADTTPHKLEAAEELFEVLTHPTISRRRVPVLLACNKMDLEMQVVVKSYIPRVCTAPHHPGGWLPKAHSLDFIKRTLEKQVDAMRKTRSAMAGADGAGRAAALGKGDKPFSLATARNPITGASISATAGDVADVHAFLLAHCK